MPPVVYRLMAIMLVQNVVVVFMVLCSNVWYVYFAIWWILAGLFWYEWGMYTRKR